MKQQIEGKPHADGIGAEGGDWVERVWVDGIWIARAPTGATAGFDVTALFGVTAFLAVTARFAFALWLLAATVSGQAATLSGPRIIDSGRLDQTPAAPAPTGEVPKAGGVSGHAAPDRNQVLTLRDVSIEGTTSLDPALLASAWRDMIGRSVRVAEVYAIADRIAAEYKQAGFALYKVDVLDAGVSDGPTGGVARLRVIEGYVTQATIEGDTRGDLSLIQKHAAVIVADRPLHQATLEREILLINDIPGVKAGSRFDPIPGNDAGVRLVLIVTRKMLEPGFGVVNVGNALLAQNQANVSLAANSLLHEGDRTQAVFGFPFQWERYQYYGLTHQEPLGNDGGTVSISGGHLVTRPIDGLPAGEADLVGLRVNYPLIRGVDQNLYVSGGFDYLNSANAVLGAAATDERTRTLRLGFSYTTKDPFQGQDEVAGVLSEGLDALGARRGTLAAGGPEFTKLTFGVARGQQLPWMLIARVRATGQVTGTALPLSEQFTYGGLDYGQAFDVDSMTGDQGVASAAEIAWHPTFERIPDWIAGSEVFVAGDWSKVWNYDTLLLPASNVGASAGVGVRLRVMNKVTLTMEAAKPLIVPRLADQGNGWRFVFAISGGF
jgi:hemolysin activation/secretion protein